MPRKRGMLQRAEARCTRRARVRFLGIASVD